MDLRGEPEMQIRKGRAASGTGPLGAGARKEVAMTTTQRQWVYVIVAGIVGGVFAFLVVWWFGDPPW
jgi:hypothetical protein